MLSNAVMNMYSWSYSMTIVAGLFYLKIFNFWKQNYFYFEK